MSIDRKIKHGWGYNCGPIPPNVVLSNGGTIIDYWPTSDPPTIAEIEAVQLPEPEPAPDWRSFRTALVVSSAYVRITAHNNHTLAILSMLVNVAFLLDSDATRAVEFAGLWNAIATIAEPTSEEITALNAIAATNNIPFTLNEQGLIQ